MHNLFIGEFQHHCRVVWGMTIKVPGAKKLEAHSTEEQQKQLEKVVAGIEKGSKTSTKRPRRGYLVAVAQVNGIRDVAGGTKAEYIDALFRWYAEKPGRTIKCPVPASEPVINFSLDPERPTQPIIINKAVLDEIRADIKRITVPSWVGHIPRNFGDPSHGKLTADQWRSGCIVYLTITLIRLWGGTGATTLEKERLRNFLDMVRSVDLGTRRSTSSARISLHAHYMHEYLAGLLQIFPDHKFVVNHHLAQHLAECMTLFGPVHGIWAFVFERYLGILRGFNTNNKSGEMEVTFLRYFCMSGNLRAFVQDLDLPGLPEYADFAASLPATFGHLMQSEDLHTLPSTAHSYTYNASKAEALGDEVYSRLLDRINVDLTPELRYSRWNSNGTLLLDRRCQKISGIEHFRARYSSRQVRHVGNSLIEFSSPISPRQTHRAGQIVDIVLHRRLTLQKAAIVEPFLVVKEYAELSPADRIHDIYRQFDHLGARLNYNRFVDGFVVLKPVDLVSHFASYVYTPDGIDEACIVVRSIDR
ncbi:hypothetical protein BV25DRAFT_1769446, partial [Artomyces pyxidatus]